MFLCDAEDSSCARQTYLACVHLAVHLSLALFQAPLIAHAASSERTGWRGAEVLWLAASQQQVQPGQGAVILRAELLRCPLV